MIWTLNKQLVVYSFLNNPEPVTYQLIGLGKYLATIDPMHNTWQWQIQRILVYCTVHFKRGIDRAIGQGDSRANDSMYGRMHELLNCKTKQDYMDLCDFLIGKIFLLIPNRLLTGSRSSWSNIFYYRLGKA